MSFIKKFKECIYSTTPNSLIISDSSILAGPLKLSSKKNNLNINISVIETYQNVIPTILNARKYHVHKGVVEELQKMLNKYIVSLGSFSQLVRGDDLSIVFENFLQFYVQNSVDIKDYLEIGNDDRKQDISDKLNYYNRYKVGKKASKVDLEQLCEGLLIAENNPEVKVVGITCDSDLFYIVEMLRKDERFISNGNYCLDYILMGKHRRYYTANTFI